MTLIQKIRILLLDIAAALILTAAVCCGAPGVLLRAAAVLLVLAMIWTAAVILLPFLRLEKYLDEIVRERRWDEVSGIARWPGLPFSDQMGEILKRYLQQLHDTEALEAYDRQATLQALQSQINPHFLYNTLETIRGQAILDGNRIIADMLEALGNFFRYSISRRENLVPLRDELDNVKRYMFIQNYRFSNRFQMTIEEPEEDDLMDCCIPKLTLQPIVENALLHAFEDRSGGEITISIDAAEKLLVITVSDDGIGMEDAALERLNLRLEGQVPEDADRTAHHGNGVALPNVNRRIRMLFGAEYGLHVYSTPGCGTDVEIVLARMAYEGGRA